LTGCRPSSSVGTAYGCHLEAADRVGHLGCSEGSPLPALLWERSIANALAADLSARSLEVRNL